MSRANLVEALTDSDASALGTMEVAISARYLAMEISWLVGDRRDALWAEGRTLAWLLENWSRRVEAERKAERV